MTKAFSTKVKDTSAKILFIICACLSIFAVFGIICYILVASVPAFREVGFFQFLFGTKWQFNSDTYGILTMLCATLAVTILAVILGGVIGVFTAIFMVFWCPDRFHLRYEGSNKFVQKMVAWLNKINLRTIFDQIIKLLAGIPSVIYGYFGIIVLVQGGLVYMDPNYRGYGVLATCIVLAIMIIPTITSLTKNALEAVPAQYFEGALAMGNTKAQAVFRVVFPAARSGIISALILGIGRAVGETMAVQMVAGGTANFPTGLFIPICPLTVKINMEMGEVVPGSLHESALMATGFVLLVLVLIITLSVNFVPKEFKGKKGTRVLQGGGENVVYRKKGLIPEILKYCGMVCAGIVVISLAAIILFICINGIPNISWSFLFGGDGYEGHSLAPAFLTTFYVIIFTLIIALPLGIGAAIFLNEYAKPGSKFVKVIRTFIDTLSGVPSIVFGLFGYLLFVQIFGRSVFAGAFTMVLVILPTIIRSTEEALRAVPMELREASYGLGASKIRTIFKVVLPSAFPGIATAIVLSVGRIISESAALIYTAGMMAVASSSVSSAIDPTNAGSTLTVFMYSFFAEGLAYEEAYATAFVLLIITFVLNLIVYFIQKSVKKKR
ncbi:MAG TPA: phosphate ABC transporter permease PstA [Firmicutes bacterium]|nr:phosphate ABC transporter permease PstA [Bacillota bacterium]